ncbi:MAG: hypothetical protein JST19_17200 [Bacteroidetes bacterium]|nr:hypothetical protein [Bacteroidota bacterium]
MIILLVIFYILFFGCADFILFSLLHKKGWIGKQAVIGFVVFLVIVVFFHVGLFKINFLIPPEAFFQCVAYLLFITMMHFMALRSIRRMYNPGNRVNIGIKDMFAKYWRFVTMILPYFLFFFIQCAQILHFMSASA